MPRWRTKFRTAEAIYGHGFVGLIPQQSRQGNRLPRLGQSVEQLLETYITDHYETLNQQSKSAVYLLFEREERRERASCPKLQNLLEPDRET
jgi:putative transposase